MILFDKNDVMAFYTSMKWTGISGSWRKTNLQVEEDVREAVHYIVDCGGGIVTGGALGVDYIATDEASKYDLRAEQIKIILPTSLEIFCAHFFNRAHDGVVSRQQALSIANQLNGVKSRNPDAVIEMDYIVCTPETYYARNQKVIDACDELLAFHVNESQGVQDAIDRAKDQVKPVTVKKYAI